MKLERFKTPILFLVFNRPEKTQLVFEAIRKIQPLNLFIAADGPRSHIEGEYEHCRQTREIVTQIDWDCKPCFLFRESNLGCGPAVSSAINWFFKQNEMGIILEDDCLPNSSFFHYCEELLKHYQNDERI
ncbi:MAG: glyocosyltransferase, partial [Opitutales bacterium]